MYAIPPANRPSRKYQQVAVATHRFPHPETFWKEFIRRRPKMDIPASKQFFDTHVCYEPSPIDSNTEGRGRCGACGNNWGGQLMKAHSAYNCGVPKNYQLEFVATNTAAYCPRCLSSEEFHVSCREKDLTCKKCEERGNGPRPHNPIVQWCKLKEGTDPTKVWEWRTAYYQHLQEESKKEPFKIRMVNDRSIKFEPLYACWGFPPLNGHHLYQPLRYAPGADYPGLLPATMPQQQAAMAKELEMLEKRQVNRQVARANPTAPVSGTGVTLTTRAPGEGIEASARLRYPSQAPAEIPAISQAPNLSFWTAHSRKEAEGIWEQESKKAATFWNTSQDVIQSLEKDVGQMGYPAKIDEEYQYYEDEYQLKPNDLKDMLIQGVLIEGSPDCFVDRAMALQNTITGQRQEEDTIRNQLFGLDSATVIVAYLEMLWKLAVVLSQSEELPKLQLADSKNPYVSARAWKELVTVPTIKSFKSVPAQVRYHFFTLWIINVAKNLEKKSSEGEGGSTSGMDNGGEGVIGGGSGAQ
ncbi:hypothetical protein GCK72_001819 [Caenorhabditis remanei]|uniref:Uncharacterized protein n=1 Tax=Caenorhabditis remanei TaxID=31234 RepID=A0A6A5HW36_CAERE|nr:hypothetical protein GCK72_001819 [Caenorhabditis remanei]KAF1770002.1 hypothetical protein GCK72_001819 [Caenorhabditis remanei]